MNNRLLCMKSPIFEDAEYFHLGDWEFWSEFLLDYWNERCVPSGISYMFLNKYFYIE